MNSRWIIFDGLGDCGTPIVFPAFVPPPRSSASSVIRWHEWSRSPGAQKNALPDLRASASRMVRPQAAAGPRPLLRRQTHLSGRGSPARRLPKVRKGETGDFGLVGG